MQLNLFPNKKEDKIEIYYTRMTPLIEQVVSIVRQEKPVIYGMCDGEKTLLNLREILYFDTVDRKNFACTKDNTYQISQSISSLEAQLGEYGFIRINKSNLINIYQIRCIRPEPNMRIRALLENGEYLQINRAYKRSFEEYLIRFRKTV